MNLSLLLDMACDGFADRTLVGRRADGLTARRLRELARAGARLVEEAGADAIVYLDVNGPAFPVALFAAAAAGVPVVPVNYRLGEEQLDALLARHPAALGIAGAAGATALARNGIRSLTADAWLTACAAADPAADAPDPPDDEAAPAVVIYTSGTTSAPKGVQLHHANLVSYVLGTVEFAAAEESEATLISVPPYHIAAVANAISNLFAGRRTVVLEQFSGAEWLSCVRDEQITHALVVPTMLARILAEPEATRAVPTLRSLAYGGAAMPPRVLEEALGAWPDVDFVNAYGLTETSSTVAVLGPDDHRDAYASADPAVRARLASAGRPVPTVELEVRREDGSPCAPGEHGRIHVRGPQISADYAGIGPALDAGGWFDTRDDGWLDGDGYLFIGGRSDDTIIRGGENIAPAEIEEVLLRHDDVLDVCVVGVADDEWGQRLEAVVVLRPGSTVGGADLQAHARANLRTSKTPERIHLGSELPRTETGKLLRREVLRRLQDASLARA